MNNMQVNMNINIPSIAICLEDNQVREFLSLGTNMSNFTNLEESSSYRPVVSAESDPRAWWR